MSVASAVTRIPAGPSASTVFGIPRELKYNWLVSPAAPVTLFASAPQLPSSVLSVAPVSPFARFASWVSSRLATKDSIETFPLYTSISLVFAGTASTTFTSSSFAVL